MTPTREYVIAWAREAAVINCDCCLPFWPEEDQVNWEIFFERFAALVAAAEREACAKVCDEKVDAEYATGKVDHNEMGWTQYCAMAIRLREKNND